MRTPLQIGKSCFAEIPLFHVLNARITFGNIFGTEEAVVGIQKFEENGKTVCTVDPSCFEPPSSYVVLGENVLLSKLGGPLITGGYYETLTRYVASN